MSVIADKVGITAEQFKKLVKEGVISTTWAVKDEIVVYYKERLKVTNKTDAVKDTADHFKKNPSDVYAILRTDIFS